MGRRKEILAIIPARAGSKRIPKKNSRKFAGKPLIAHSIEHALNCSAITRIIVDTDSKDIAVIAKKYGAEVPFIRPKKLALDTSDVNEAILFLLERLKKDEGYVPEYFVLLQPTSPLRKINDIDACLKILQNTNATTVLTIVPTHPMFFHLKKNGELEFINGSLTKRVGRTQDWPDAYILNGCVVYAVKTSAFIRIKRIITPKTRAVVMPKWRSVDLDEIEEWVIAEVLYRSRSIIERRLKKFK